MEGCTSLDLWRYRASSKKKSHQEARERGARFLLGGCTSVKFCAFPLSPASSRKERHRKAREGWGQDFPHGGAYRWNLLPPPYLLQAAGGERKKEGEPGGLSFLEKFGVF